MAAVLEAPVGELFRQVDDALVAFIASCADVARLDLGGRTPGREFVVETGVVGFEVVAGGPPKELPQLALLIVVGVGLDTIQQIESHLVMRHYDGFTGARRMRGRRR